MIKSGARLSILAWNEFTCDQPEWAWLGRLPAPGFAEIPARDYRDARARGMGGSATDPFCSCAEENLLAYPGDPYAAENILIHEFAHNIHLRGMANVDPGFDARVKAAYDAAMQAGLWKGKYAGVNHHEYFAEGVQSWFDNNRENDHDHNHVNTNTIRASPRCAARSSVTLNSNTPSRTRASPATSLATIRQRHQSSSGRNDCSIRGPASAPPRRRAATPPTPRRFPGHETRAPLFVRSDATSLHSILIHAPIPPVLHPFPQHTGCPSRARCRTGASGPAQRRRPPHR